MSSLVFARGFKINQPLLLITTVTHVSPQFQGKPQAFFRHLRGLYSYFSNQETIWRSHSRLEIKELLYVSYITVSVGNSQLQQLLWKTPSFEPQTKIISKNSNQIHSLPDSSISTSQEGVIYHRERVFRHPTSHGRKEKKQRAWSTKSEVVHYWGEHFRNISHITDILQDHLPNCLCFQWNHRVCSIFCDKKGFWESDVFCGFLEGRKEEENCDGIFRLRR